MTIDEALIYFQEMGFQVNELKKQNVKTVDIDTYERLLNWIIESLRMRVGIYEEFDDITNKHK
jgi:uncharacterized protein YggL (DUF469 family)